MRGNDFIFDCVYLLYYKCYKINFKGGGSYIGSPDWVKNKKARVNPINKKDNSCFQYSVTVALNNEESKKDPRRITKIKHLIDKYNCKGINYPSKKYILKRITLRHHDDFYCLNCLHSFATENRRETHNEVCENKRFL